MANLATLIKTIKPYCKNPQMSDENFLNEFIAPYVEAGNIKNKNKEPFRLNKSRVSDLLKQKSDIPKVLRVALSLIGIKDKTQEYFGDFIEDYIEESKINDLQTALKNPPFNEHNKSENICNRQENLSELLTHELLLAISECNKITDHCIIIWKRGKNRVSLIEGDLFKYGFNNRTKTKNIVVIPVNTSFETHVTRKFERESNPIISDTSIHGQWLTRAKKSGLTDLDHRILEGLNQEGIAPSKLSESSNTKKSCYPIGTISVIEDKKSIFYLLAISHFDKNNNAQSSPNDIKMAVKCLVEYHNIHGQGYPLYIPLLGTGLSRAGLSYQDSYEIIKETLLKNSMLIQGNIFIIFPLNELSEIIV